jgi:polyisoprenoid-binding protein YceI
MAWEIDPFHTLVEFSVIHLMISTVKGRFTDVHGSIHLDPKRPENSWVKAHIKADSITTDASQRDTHLRSADFFEASRYPIINFESTQVQLVDHSRCVLTGELTLHGVTRTVPFHVTYTGQNRDMFTNAWRVGMYAMTVIDRRDFNMHFDQSKMGISLVGHKVRIEVNVEAVLTE